jgi:hypothetical protein
MPVFILLISSLPPISQSVARRWITETIFDSFFLIDYCLPGTFSFAVPDNQPTFLAGWTSTDGIFESKKPFDYSDIHTDISRLCRILVYRNHRARGEKCGLSRKTIG